MKKMYEFIKTHKKPIFNDIDDALDRVNEILADNEIVSDAEMRGYRGKSFVPFYEEDWGYGEKRTSKMEIGSIRGKRVREGVYAKIVVTRTVKGLYTVNVYLL